MSVLSPLYQPVAHPGLIVTMEHVSADTEEILCLPSGQALVQVGYCVTFDEDQALTQLGQCAFKYVVDNKHVPLLQYYSLPSNVSELDDVMCGPFNRTGMLCGKCKDGYYPLVNSLDVNCVQCPNGWSNLWKFVMVAFLLLLSSTSLYCSLESMPPVHSSMALFSVAKALLYHHLSVLLCYMSDTRVATVKWR